MLNARVYSTALQSPYFRVFLPYWMQWLNKNRPNTLFNYGVFMELCWSRELNRQRIKTSSSQWNEPKGERRIEEWSKRWSLQRSEWERERKKAEEKEAEMERGGKIEGERGGRREIKRKKEIDRRRILTKTLHWNQWVCKNQNQIDTYRHKIEYCGQITKKNYHNNQRQLWIW